MFLKKLVSYILLPFPVAVGLIAVGIVLLWFTARQRTGKVLITVGVGALLFFSTGLFARWYVDPLMRLRPVRSLVDAPGAKWVVVLGAGCSKVRDLPATARLNAGALQRLVEGVRLYRTQPGTKLLLSGGFGSPGATEAEVMAQAAQDLGVPRADMVLETTSLDTQDQAVTIRKIVHDDKFALVTSRMHMQRSLKLFKKQGLDPFPAPAGYWSRDSTVLPSSGQLVTADAADHEYVGILWSLLRGTL